MELLAKECAVRKPCCTTATAKMNLLIAPAFHITERARFIVEMSAPTSLGTKGKG
jgi:hypothetical protein